MSWSERDDLIGAGQCAMPIDQEHDVRGDTKSSRRVMDGGIGHDESKKLAGESVVLVGGVVGEPCDHSRTDTECRATRGDGKARHREFFDRARRGAVWYSWTQRRRDYDRGVKRGKGAGTLQQGRLRRRQNRSKIYRR